MSRHESIKAGQFVVMRQYLSTVFAGEAYATRELAIVAATDLAKKEGCATFVVRVFDCFVPKQTARTLRHENFTEDIA